MKGSNTDRAAQSAYVHSVHRMMRLKQHGVTSRSASHRKVQRTKGRDGDAKCIISMQSFIEPFSIYCEWSRSETASNLHTFNKAHIKCVHKLN